SAALIGAGRYTLSHWKLESTSRGLLVIGTLLVPLSFMVLAGVASGRAGGIWEVVTEVAAVGVFAWLVGGAMKILLRNAVGQAAPGAGPPGPPARFGPAAPPPPGPHLQGSESLA